MRSHWTVSRRALFAVAAVAPLLACEPDADPSRLTAPLVASRSAAPPEAPLSPAWQAIQPRRVAHGSVPAVVPTPAYSLPGVAEYLAAQPAGRRGRHRHGCHGGPVAGP